MARRKRRRKKNGLAVKAVKKLSRKTRARPTRAHGERGRPRLKRRTKDLLEGEEL